MSAWRVRSVLGTFVLALLYPAVATADWGGIGTGPGRFLAPTAIAVGPTGAVYVSDSDQAVSPIQVFTDQGALGSALGGPGLFTEPRGLAVDAAGSLFVADAVGNRIVKLDADGRLLTSWGTAGTGEGQFERPIAVATDPVDRVYALDATGALQQFTSDGAFTGRWQLPAEASKQPSDLAVAPNGDVLALDAGSGIITTFDPSGNVIDSFGARGLGNGQLQNGSGIAVNALGNVYVADSGGNRVAELSAQGAFIANVDASARLSSPVDVAVAPSGDLFVLNGGDGRVVVLDSATGSASEGTSSPSTLAVTGVSGRVLARKVGARVFVPVKGVLPVEAGWVIDARHGNVTLQASTRRSDPSPSTVRLRAGIVAIRLRKKTGVELELTGGSFADCDRSRRGQATVRSVSATISGRYAVIGRDSATRSSLGSVTVADSCAGTTTRVLRGTATVTPLHDGRPRVLSAGQEYRAAHH